MKKRKVLSNRDKHDVYEIFNDGDYGQVLEIVKGTEYEGPFARYVDALDEVEHLIEKFKYAGDDDE